MVLRERPITADSLSELALQVLQRPSLFRTLHVPENYATTETPEWVMQGRGYVSSMEWSRALAQAQSNGFRSEEGSMLLLEKTALFNHSCKPNAAAYFHQGRATAEVRALREIGQGQEIALCYDSQLLLMPREERRKILHRRWGFVCECPRCMDPQDPTDQMLVACNRHRKEGDSVGVGGATIQEELAMKDAFQRAEQSFEEAAQNRQLSSVRAAAESLHAALELSQGKLQVTHWQVQLTLRNLASCWFMILNDEQVNYERDVGVTEGL